ncbi:MAG: WD40/YVTN/BNR-like repeat-containing protein, partial [Thermoanaerobaculia bacterium]
MARFLALLLLLTACTASVPTAELEEREHDDPDVAYEYYSMKRAGTDDIHRSYALAKEAMQRMPRYATEGDTFVRGPRDRVASNAETERPFGNWKFLGPGNIGGRTRAIVIDKNDPRVMYAAGVSGGIWKSRSAGHDWAPIGDDLMNIAVNAMTMHPTDSNILYAGTGEGYFRESERGTALPLRGNGIFVTRDAGESWTQLPGTNNENFHWVNDLVVSTHDPSRVYAATRTGVWRSVDSGTTWKRVLETTVKGGCLDLAWRGDTSGDYLFASCGTFEQATVYRNSDAQLDGNWESVLSEDGMGRTTLAIAPSRPSVIYALSASNEADPDLRQGLLAVWRSDSNGDAGSWSPRVTNAEADDVVGRFMLTNRITVYGEICGGADTSRLTMGWYCNTIAVDPVDHEKVWVGGVDLFRS